MATEIEIEFDTGTKLLLEGHIQAKEFEALKTMSAGAKPGMQRAVCWRWYGPTSHLPAAMNPGGARPTKRVFMVVRPWTLNLRACVRIAGCEALVSPAVDVHVNAAASGLTLPQSLTGVLLGEDSAGKLPASVHFFDSADRLQVAASLYPRRAQR